MLPYILVFIALLQPEVRSVEYPVLTEPVFTKKGAFQGLVKEFEGKPFSVFRGIPYAAPPVEDLRWQKPAPPILATGIQNATRFGWRCPQFGGRKLANENCLFMNIYVPGDQPANASANMPVLVFVHGGAFLLGDSESEVGDEIVTLDEIVYVNFNYRLGPLGFVATSDGSSVGNFALWDQKAALEWIHENIGFFGGDPNRLTLIGHSAGSASISHLSLSPMTNKMFNNAILMSGNANSYFGISDNLEEISRMLGSFSLCWNIQDSKMVDCLRKRDSMYVTLAGFVAPVIRRFHYPSWSPRVDGDFVTQHPRVALERGFSTHINLLLGRCSDDAAFLMYLAFGDRRPNLAQTKRLTRTAIVFIMNYFENRDTLVDMVYEEYPDLASNDTLSREKALLRCVTDYFFGTPMYFEASMHSAYIWDGKTYFYEFAQRPDYRENSTRYPSWLNADHGDDRYSFFGQSSYDESYGLFSENDKLLSEKVRSHFLNFVHTGNPNEGPHPVEAEWELFTAQNNRKMKFETTPKMMTIGDEELQKYKFWMEKFYPAQVPRKQSSAGDFTRRPRDWEAWFVEQIEALELKDEHAIGQLFYLSILASANNIPEN